jgi:hypothetical protein
MGQHGEPDDPPDARDGLQSSQGLRECRAGGCRRRDGLVELLDLLWRMRCSA